MLPIWLAINLPKDPPEAASVSSIPIIKDEHWLTNKNIRGFVAFNWSRIYFRSCWLIPKFSYRKGTVKSDPNPISMDGIREEILIGSHFCPHRMETHIGSQSCLCGRKGRKSLLVLNPDSDPIEVTRRKESPTMGISKRKIFCARLDYSVM